MKIAISGVAGQVGQQLACDLSTEHEVIALDRVRLDVSDIASIAPTIAAIRPELFIHCAAYTKVDAAEEEQETAFQVNAEAPGAIARACKDVGAKLIHFSTDYVFDGRANRPYREDDPTHPINAYGRSKLAGEEAVVQSGAEAIILRTSWVYSAGGQNFFRTMLRLGAERETIKVVNDQIGSPTTVHAIAEAIRKLIGSRKFPPGIYHFTSAGETSWYGFANEIFTFAKQYPDVLRNIGSGELIVRNVVPIFTAEYPTPAARPLYSVLDTSKFQQTFGFGMEDWKSGLRGFFAEPNAVRAPR